MSLMTSALTRSRRSGSDAAFCSRSVWRVMGPLLGIDGIVTAALQPRSLPRWSLCCWQGLELFR